MQPPSSERLTLEQLPPTSSVDTSTIIHLLSSTTTGQQTKIGSDITYTPQYTQIMHTIHENISVYYLKHSSVNFAQDYEHKTA